MLLGGGGSGGGSDSSGLGPPLSGTNGNDILYGTNSHENIYGLEGDDEIYGLEGEDDLYGGDGNDTLYGGDGNDYLYGGEGHDTLVGGAGKDTFIYDSITDGFDDIYDFKVGTDPDSDVLDLAALLTYNPNNPSHNINNFISFDDGTNTTLNIDVNGDGSGFTDLSIELVSVTGTDLNTIIADGNIVLF